jgi:hypothetical protein
MKSVSQSSNRLPHKRGLRLVRRRHVDFGEKTIYIKNSWGIDVNEHHVLGVTKLPFDLARRHMKQNNPNGEKMFFTDVLLDESGLPPEIRGRPAPSHDAQIRAFNNSILMAPLHPIADMMEGHYENKSEWCKGNGTCPRQTSNTYAGNFTVSRCAPLSFVPAIAPRCYYYYTALLLFCMISLTSFRVANLTGATHRILKISQQSRTCTTS